MSINSLLSAVLDDFQDTTFETLPQRSIEFRRRIRQIESSLTAQEITPRDLREAESLLKEHSFTIICPVPLPDVKGESLYSGHAQHQLNEALSTYIAARGLSFIPVDSSIRTIVLLDTTKEEALRLARVFYQAYTIYSSNGVNEFLYPRDPSRPSREGKGWRSPKEGDPFIRMPLKDGNVWNFTLEIDFADNSLTSETARYEKKDSDS